MAQLHSTRIGSQQAQGTSKRKKPLLSLQSTIASLDFKRALKMPGFENTQDTEGAEKGRCSLLKWQKRICVHKFKENELKRNLQIRNGNYLKCQKEIQSQMKGTKRQTGAVLRWEKNDCIQMKLLIQDPQQSTLAPVWANAPGRSGAGRGHGCAGLLTLYVRCTWESVALGPRCSLTRVISQQGCLGLASSLERANHSDPKLPSWSLESVLEKEGLPCLSSQRRYVAIHVILFEKGTYYLENVAIQH